MFLLINTHRQKVNFILLSSVLTMWLSVAFASCAHADTITTESSHACCPESEQSKQDKEPCHDLEVSCVSCLAAADAPVINASSTSPDKKGDAKVILPKPTALTASTRPIVLARGHPCYFVDSIPPHPSLQFRVLLI